MSLLSSYMQGEFTVILHAKRVYCHPTCRVSLKPCALDVSCNIIALDVSCNITALEVSCNIKALDVSCNITALDV